MAYARLPVPNASVLASQRDAQHMWYRLDASLQPRPENKFTGPGIPNASVLATGLVSPARKMPDVKV